MLTVVKTIAKKADDTLFVPAIAKPSAKSATTIVAGNNTRTLKRCAKSAPTAKVATGSQIIVDCLNAPVSGQTRPATAKFRPVG
jgi:hypothetical protein